MTGAMRVGILLILFAVSVCAAILWHVMGTEAFIHMAEIVGCIVGGVITFMSLVIGIILVSHEMG